MNVVVRINAIILCLLLLGGGRDAYAQRTIDEVHRQFIKRLTIGAERDEMDGKPFRTFMKEEKIALLEGNFTLLKELCYDTTAVMSIDLMDGKRYAVRFFRDSLHSAALSYPASYELILDIKSFEMEDRLSDAVRRTIVPKETPFQVAHELLEQMGNSPVYILSRTTYLLPELNNNRYYVKVDDATFSLLYSEDFPIETMANLVTGNEIESGIDINFKMVKYNYRTEEFTVPLRQWITFCLNEGCSPYFGLISLDTSLATCVLVMKNETLGYIHAMKMTFDPAIISTQSDKAGNRRMIRARLNSYIPIYNVKSIFQEDDEK